MTNSFPTAPLIQVSNNLIGSFCFLIFCTLKLLQTIVVFKTTVVLINSKSWSNFGNENGNYKVLAAISSYCPQIAETGGDQRQGLFRAGTRQP
jgi:hypothetical protein